MTRYEPCHNHSTPLPSTALPMSCLRINELAHSCDVSNSIHILALTPQQDGSNDPESHQERKQHHQVEGPIVPRHALTADQIHAQAIPWEQQHARSWGARTLA